MSGPDVRAIQTEGLPVEAFPEVTQAFRVVLSEEAFDRAVARAKEDVDREIGGVLVGRLCRDAGGPYVRVETTIDALHAEEKSTELTFTHETWAHIHEVMDRDHPDREIVGWYHTHPGFGIFLSDRDVFIHRSFFDSPQQVALVYDPKSREHGVFAWREGEPERCRRYWIGLTEQNWEPPAARTEKPSKTAKEKTKPEGEARSEGAGDPPPPMDRLSLAIGAVILLLLGGLIGWWFAGGSRGRAPEARRQELLVAKMAGAKETVERLNLDVLLLLRKSMNGQAIARASKAMERLDRGLVILLKTEDPPADEEARKQAEEEREKALSDVTAAQSELRSLISASLTAAMTLEELALVKTTLDDPRQTRQALSLHAAALGQVYVELADAAAKSGNTGRARRLLATAAQVDPGKRELYDAKMAALGEVEEGSEK